MRNKRASAGHKIVKVSRKDRALTGSSKAILRDIYEVLLPFDLF